MCYLSRSQRLGEQAFISCDIANVCRHHLLFWCVRELEFINELTRRLVQIAQIIKTRPFTTAGLASGTFDNCSFLATTYRFVFAKSNAIGRSHTFNAKTFSTIASSAHFITTINACTEITTTRIVALIVINWGTRNDITPTNIVLITSFGTHLNSQLIELLAQRLFTIGHTLGILLNNRSGTIFSTKTTVADDHFTALNYDAQIHVTNNTALSVNGENSLFIYSTATIQATVTDINPNNVDTQAILLSAA